VTKHPTGTWVIQRLREAVPYDIATHHLTFDRDAIFNAKVEETAKALGVKPVRTAFKSPRQNGVAERFVGSCRRDLLDHVVVFNKRHLKRIMTEYVRYYLNERTKPGSSNQTPARRETTY
jgi:transposase InsO family protein